MKKLLLLALLPLFFACAEKQREKSVYDFSENYSLEGRLYDTEIVAKYSHMFLSSDTVAITRNFGVETDFIDVFSIPGGFKKTASYGIIGRGPLEFRSPRITTVDANNIYVQNSNAWEVVRLEISDSGNKISEAERLSFMDHPKMDLNIEPNGPVHLSSGYYAGASYNNDPVGFFSLWDDSLKFVRFFGDSPIPEKVAPINSANFLQGSMRAYRDKLVFVSGTIPYMAMYEVKDDKPIQKWAKYYQEPFYAVRNEEVLFYKDKTFGMAEGLAIGKDHIYVLYLDILRSQYDASRSEYCNAGIILVFDHKGNNIARLELDHRLAGSSIAVSSDERKLYGIAVTPEYQFIEYDLPKLRK